MTAGDQNGTNGWTRGQRGAWLLIAAVAFLVALINATSRILETQRDGEPLPPAAPFLWEFSSALVLVAMAPLIGEAIRRLPPRQASLPRFFFTHLALTVPFSAIHVAAMVAIRKVGYALVGSFYDFSHGDLPREFFYEWRKDALTYSVLATVYWFFQHRAAVTEAARANAGDQRIEVRDGGAAVFLTPGDILFVEAAGNYVEFHTSSRTHLVRGTLASWEARLTARGFVRVHRSRLVNRAKISAIKPTPSGDVEITLTDGRSITGSRRYRADLPTAQT